MGSKVSNISDLINRVASSCLLHPLARTRDLQHNQHHLLPDDADDSGAVGVGEKQEEEHQANGRSSPPSSPSSSSSMDDEREEKKRGEREREVEWVMEEVFHAVTAVKRAYVTLQQAHNPWDPHNMRLADAAVVAELRHLSKLRERFRRGGGGGCSVPAAASAAAEPYEAVVEELRREVRAKEAEVAALRDKLRRVSSSSSAASVARGRFHPSHRRVSCIARREVAEAEAPTAELFVTWSNHVKEVSKSFSSHLLSLMRSAGWDIPATTSSILHSFSITTTTTTSATTGSTRPHHHHAKHAVETYVARKLFEGFENETFYLDGSLSSLLHPAKFRQECFAQFRRMRPLKPPDLLALLSPSSTFHLFCRSKFLSLVHPKMEESLLPGLDHRQAILIGDHPNSEFYAEFLQLAKAVWLLHLLAFALDPPPSLFEAALGAEFNPEFMESVVKGCAGRGSQKVGFPVSPGFKLATGSVVKARVYLVPQTSA